MNNIKRILSLMLVLALAVALTVPVSAESLTITGLNGTAAHQFTAYQIFSGNLVSEDVKVTVDSVAYQVWRTQTGDTIYQTADDADWLRVSDNSFYAHAIDVDKAKLSKEVESKLSNIVWGANILAAGRVALFEKYVGKARTATENVGGTEVNFVAYKANGAANWSYYQKTASGLVAIGDSDPLYSNVTAINWDGASCFTDYETGAFVDNNLNNNENAAASVAEKLHGMDATSTIELAEMVANGTDFLGKWTEDSPAPKVVTSAASDKQVTISDLNAGYYLVKETGDLNGQVGAYSRYMLRVLGNVQVATKASAPTLIKKVKENSPLVGVDNVDQKMDDFTLEDQWNDVADYSIGDTIPFELVASMPTTYADYQTYTLIFNDAPAAPYGISLSTDKNDYKLEVVHTDGSKTPVTIGDDAGNVVLTANANSMSLKIVNTRAIVDNSSNQIIDAASKLVLTYKGTLNENAVVGSTGNLNTAYLQYSNNPNWHGNPTTDVPPLGKSEEDEVIVYTYGLDVNKVAREQTSATPVTLNGAKFKLYSVALDKWAKVTNGKVSAWVTENEASELMSQNGGKLAFVGLDQGHYQLKETVAPVGYNLLTRPIAFVINATTTNSQKFNSTTDKPLTKLELTVTENDVAVSETGTVAGNVTTGTVSMTVTNQAGNQLPVTGGMGTTLFYIAGAILVVGAGVLLVVRRRMSEDQ